MLNKYGLKKNSSSFAFGITIMAFLMAISGCAGNYGTIQMSREAGRIFEGHKVLDDHIYYYSGPEAIPYAIIAIHQDYTLKTTLWKRINLSSDQLKTWLNLGMHGLIGMSAHGSFILGPDGQKIGIWYSIFYGTVVKLENDNIVVVHPPISAPGKNVRPSLDRGSNEIRQKSIGKG
ncbi:MAG: hypothetical protein R6U27_17285 [Desulfobacterales bacterium]